MKFLSLLLVCGSLSLVSTLHQDHIDDFKRRNHLRKDADISLQDIPPTSSYFLIGDLNVSLLDKDLVPLNLFTEDAVFEVDHVRYEKPGLVFTSINDADLLITKTERNGRLLSAHHTSYGLELVRVKHNTYATIHASHYDNDKLKKFLAEGASPNQPETFQQEDFSNTIVQHNHRSLRIRTCQNYGGYDVITVGLVVDSLLCEAYGGKALASATVQSLFASSSSYYQVNGLCKKLSIGFLKMYCNPTRDPIRKIHDNMAMNNDNSPFSLLQKFSEFAGKKKNWNTSIIHLLHGKQFPTNTIGFAWVNAACEKGWNTGVDFMNWTSLFTPRAVIIAHESGHLLNCPHVSNDQDIMNPTIRSSGQSFLADSIATINVAVDNRRSCIKFESFSV